MNNNTQSDKFVNWIPSTLVCHSFESFEESYSSFLTRPVYIIVKNVTPPHQMTQTPLIFPFSAPLLNKIIIYLLPVDFLFFLSFFIFEIM